ncbi:hypothetical protein DL769_001664 [Monosporascus sp. CRB-8-3]|nr:hypothetical protein DL769_001664 [Monosporascus sp. CRB-8-3]
MRTISVRGSHMSQTASADPRRLESYTEECQPVGAQFVEETNNHMGKHIAVWKALGLLGTLEEGRQLMAELSAPRNVGSETRARLHAASKGKQQEGGSIDPLVKIQISRYTGSRLPHAWLDVPIGRKKISAKGVDGHGSFCLPTGIGGNARKRAAENISRVTGIPIRSYGIGFGLDYHDSYRGCYATSADGRG